MKQKLFALLFAATASCGLIRADIVTVPDLPQGDIDTLSITLTPADGALGGAPGDSVGWGFTVDWTSTNGDYLSFISSSIGSLDQGETNPSLLGSYTDFIGAQGGPDDFGVAPGDRPWSESYDGITQGVGAYQITTDPGVAIQGAQDTGEITFDYVVYNGDPLNGGAQIGDGSYSYYGPSTEFGVTVTPEPSAGWLAGLGFAGVGLLAARRRKL